MRMPWSLRPVVKDIISDIEKFPDNWFPNPYTATIVYNNGRKICLWTAWIVARIHEPTVLHLTTREWWLLKKALNYDSANVIKRALQQ